LTHRDQDERTTDGEPREPTGGETEESAPAGPAPATWAGRRRSSPEEPGERDDTPVDEPEEVTPAEEEETGDGEDPQALSDAAEPAEPEAVMDSDEEDPEADEASGTEPEAEEPGDADAGPDTAERVAQDTVEADTLALADREAAREAALAGLRARAAQHGKQGTEAITAPPPKAPPPGEAQADGHEPAAKVPPAQPPSVAASEEAEDLPRRRGMWLRFVAGSFLIIAAMATATAVSLFFFINGVLADFHGVKGVEGALTVAHPGQPQTILILGSDRRADEPKALGARSDTTILLRIASDQITVLSIPRDLKVNIPGHGLDKFNAAYTYGGAPLTLKVVKQITGITEINHIVNVDFTGFASAVNAIGCVYVDVDHHYYHSNYGLPAIEQYAEIDIDAGYQRMCGLKALQYVRYRHDDNDLVRSARQQDFLRQLRQELPASRIASQYDQLRDILAKYVTLDIRSPGDLLALTQLILAANGAPVVQVHFPANLGGPTAPYVTASDSAIKAAVAKFEGTAPEPVPGETTGDTEASGGSGGGTGSSGGSGGSSATTAPAPVIDATSSALDYAGRLDATKTEGGDKMLDFPLYYPTKLATDSGFTDDSRAFLIDGPGDEVYRGYKLVAQIPTDGYTAYYGVSGTDWKDPPILDHPDETRTIDGRDYLLSWDGPQLRLIGWKTDQGSYWVDNTLLNALTPGQMFAIAESMQKYTGG
jgi:LCP family protein required for cell wall assembly